MTGHTSRILPLFIAAIMALMSGACRSHKNAAVPSAGGLSGEAEAPVSHSTAPMAELAAMALAASYSDWTDVQMPVRMELTAPKNFAISGRASMVRGKAIYISMRMLGLEVASVYIDTDTVVVMEKLKKTAYVESLPKFTAAFGLTVGDIQDLLLGRAFAPGTGTLAQGNMSLFKTDAALFSSDGITAITPALSEKSALELVFAVDESM